MRVTVQDLDGRFATHDAFREHYCRKKGAWGQAADGRSLQVWLQTAVSFFQKKSVGAVAQRVQWPTFESTPPRKWTLALQQGVQLILAQAIFEGGYPRLWEVAQILGFGWRVVALPEDYSGVLHPYTGKPTIRQTEKAMVQAVYREWATTSHVFSIHVRRSALEVDWRMRLEGQVLYNFPLPEHLHMEHPSAASSGTYLILFYTVFHSVPFGGGPLTG